MKKEKTVRAYTRKTKSGKSVQVRQHTASYESADEMAKQALKNKKGAGDELKSAKKKMVEDDNDYGFSAADYKEWYNWDMNEDQKNSAALKVEKALKKKLGRKGYQKYFDDMSDNYTSRGANKNFKGLSKLFDSSNVSAQMKETKGDRAVARMHKLVNEAFSSTTSDPKDLKKQLGALIDYNGGPVNRGDKIGKRIDEIREQLGKRSSKKRVDKKEKPSNKYGGLTKSEYEKWQKDFNKRVKDADKGTRAKYYFTDIKKKIKSADISEAARKRLLKSIEKPYAVVTPTTMEKRLQKELDKKKKPSAKTSKAEHKTKTKDKSIGKKNLSAKEEYTAYRKAMDEKKKTGKRLSVTETTKLKKLAKAAGVGRFID